MDTPSVPQSPDEERKARTRAYKHGHYLRNRDRYMRQQRARREAGDADARAKRVAYDHDRYLGNREKQLQGAREKRAAETVEERTKRLAYHREYFQGRREHYKAQKAEYYAKHRDDILTKAKERRAQDPQYGRAIYARRREQQQAYMEGYRAENREALHAYNRLYYAQTKEAQNAASRAYYVAHRDERLRQHQEWSQTPVGQESNRNAARRRRIRKADVLCDFTPEQWLALVRAKKYRCEYCGQRFPFKKLTQDHITPISKGGAHTLSNIVPACKSCNSKKRDKGVLNPVQPLLLV